MNKVQRRYVMLGVLAVVIAGLLYIVISNLTWKEKEIDLGHSDAARKDRFLALKRLLERKDIPLETLRSFQILDQMAWQGENISSDDTLVLFNAYKMVQGQRLDNLLNWVEAGGTVITSTSNPFIGNNTEISDALLDYFEVSVIKDINDDETDDEAEDTDSLPTDDTDEDCSEPEDTSTSDGNLTQNPDASNETSDDAPDCTKDDVTTGNTDDKKEAGTDKKITDEDDDKDIDVDSKEFRCSLDEEPVDVEFASEDEPLLIDYSMGTAFEYYGEDPQGWAGNHDGLHLAQFDWGEGQVIINSDNNIWSNSRIDCHDHAYAFLKLINTHGKVWIVINQEAPSLWAVIWRGAPYGASFGLLALLFWLWNRSARFGPVFIRTSSGRRSLAEHIHASSMLLWRRQQHPHLVTLLRNDVRQLLRRHYPDIDQWSQQEQITHLKELTSLTEAELDAALFSEKLHHPNDFTLAVACLQTIRKSL